MGYLQLESFAPPVLSEGKVASAMDKLADGRTRLNAAWSRDTGSASERWTEDRLQGKRYGGKKPVFILVDRETKSAAEDFAYTMQALKRATIAGSRTWGGAHPACPYRLGDHFVASVPDARLISPITHSNWAGTGVIPDVEAAPADALKAAQALLLRRARVAALP